MLTETIGGSELTVPAHATVMMLGLASRSAPRQESMTAGTGLRRVQGSNVRKFSMDYISPVLEDSCQTVYNVRVHLSTIPEEETLS